MAKNDDAKPSAGGKEQGAKGSAGAARPATKPGAPAARGRSQDDLLARLMPIFQAEADERLRAVEQSLLELEKAPPADRQSALIEGVMRDAHSIKGGARTVNLKHVEEICQQFESVTAKMRDGELGLSAPLFDVLHATVDLITEMLNAPQDTNDARVTRVLGSLDGLMRGEPAAPAQLVTPAAPATPAPPVLPTGAPTQAPILAPAARQQSLRVSIEKLDDLFRQAQELLAVKLTTTQRHADIRDVSAQLEQWRRQWSKVDTAVRRVQVWVEANQYTDNSPLTSSARRVIEFLDWSVSHIKAVESRLKALARTADIDRLNLGLMVDGLLDDTRKILALPCATLFAAVPRMVRDLSQSGHKQVSLQVTGDDIEIDKRIVDEMKDPIVHLVRNCIDHGVETPDERTHAGKSATATLRIAVSRLGTDKVVLRVEDDGRGIDTRRVSNAAVKGQMISLAEIDQLSREEAIQLIFRSGLSTSPTVTRISGRGLGMPIVRERVENLGGRISVESVEGRGTAFVIVLPLTLATLRGILLMVGGQRLVIPTINVERVLSVKRSEIQTGGEIDTVTIGEEGIPCVPLNRVLRMARRQGAEEGNALLVIVAAAGRRVAFEVDAVEYEQEVLFKGLGGYLARVPNVSGATVLGSGQVVPILNATDLVHTAFGSAGLGELPEAVDVEEEEVVRKILVAEDSITSRMLLKEILESVGYQVTTAVDGAEALALLDELDVDLVVSDIEMPRLDGFGLTEGIRKHPRLGEVPVILVSGLERQRDRERGMNAGASAYIVKSSFDQSDLLKVIEDLI